MGLLDFLTSRKGARLDAIAQRIKPAARWSDLVIPDEQRRILLQCAAEVHDRSKSPSGSTANGLTAGTSLLLVGGTARDRAIAAEALAADLQVELLRVDLSALVTQYIGETEKNLRQVFDTAESSGCILFFDEADALFGKRSEVKDSHDRYANAEASYLLQRMESYQGLVILASNQRERLDEAFIRRLRYVVQLPGK